MNYKLFALLIFIAALPACCMRQKEGMDRKMPKKKMMVKKDRMKPKKPMVKKNMATPEMPLAPMAVQTEMPLMPNKQERMRMQQPIHMGAQPMMEELQMEEDMAMDESSMGMQELNQIMEEMGGMEGAQ